MYERANSNRNAAYSQHPQKAIATSTKGLNKHAEAFIVTNAIGLTAENHVEMPRTSQEMTEDLGRFDGG
jgi:hypothetical protein